jgi:propionaldehyde dehydrogenase
MNLSAAEISKIVEDVVKDVMKGEDKSRHDCWLCDTAEEAIASAKASQAELMKLSLEQRGKLIDSMRRIAMENVRYLSELAHKETGYGKIEDKILKNKLAIEKTPGIEDLHTDAYTGDHGLSLVERAPFGVIGAITPSTNPTSTIINNSISMIAAGNAVVFNAHPAAKKASTYAMRILNEAIAVAGGPKSLICAPKEPTVETSKVIMEHKDVPLLVVTGGEAVVKVAMKTGKKVIAAGPGNPPVIVDDTANIAKAAKDIVDGASFDNNVLCIAEKEVFAYRTIADELMAQMQKHGAYKTSGNDIEKIVKTVLINKDGKYVINRNFVGRDATHILKESGVAYSGNPRLVIADVDENHPFVTVEMLMPVLPIVKINNDIDEAIEKAIKAEAGCHHTAMIHSENVTNLSKAARALNTTIFVKNAPSYAGLGFNGEGYTTLSIATPTGEGITSARTFTRSRRCVLYGNFRIV